MAARDLDVLPHRRGGGRRTSRVVALAVIIMFIIAFINWIIDIVNLNIEARYTLIDDPDNDLDTKFTNAEQVVWHWTSIQAMLYSYMVCSFVAIYVSDAHGSSTEVKYR